MARAGFVAVLVTGVLALGAPAAATLLHGIKRVRVPAAVRSTSFDWAFALAIQRDGKLIAAGRSARGGWHFGLARYNDRGELDSSFGDAGKVRSLFGSSLHSAAASALAIQRDGNVVADGRSGVGALDDLTVARYTSRGRLDPSFGRGGAVLTGFGLRKRISGWANALAIQKDGKLVAAGGSGDTLSGPTRFALVRYTASGNLDRSFGRGGTVVTRLGSYSDGLAIAIQRDGKVLVAGRAWTGSRTDFALARYTVGGKLDSSFGRGGMLLTPFGSWNGAEAVALQADGKIVVAGGEAGDFAVARYTAAGRLDPTFGDGGKVVTNFGFRGPAPDESSEAAHALALQRDGRIVVAGATDRRGASGEKSCCIKDFALARYTPDGELDPSFGNDGLVLTPFAGNVEVDALALDVRGRIAAAGGGSCYFALARYTARGKLDPTFGQGGKVKTNFVRGRGS